MNHDPQRPRALSAPDDAPPIADLPAPSTPIDIDGVTYPCGAVIEALAPHLSDARLTRLRHVASHRLGSIVLGLEDLHHGHNGSACLRTAEGLGLQDVAAAEPREQFPGVEPRAEDLAVRHAISLGAHRWLDLHRFADAAGLMAWARDRGLRPVAAGPRGEHTLDDLPLDQPLLMMFGNEAEGLRDETLAACSLTWRIPMYGFAESFNVSVSVGMALNAVVARRRAALAWDGRLGDLPPERHAHLLASWCLRDVRGGPAIIRRKLS